MSSSDFATSITPPDDPLVDPHEETEHDYDDDTSAVWHDDAADDYGPTNPHCDYDDRASASLLLEGTAVDPTATWGSRGIEPPRRQHDPSGRDHQTVVRRHGQPDFKGGLKGT